MIKTSAMFSIHAIHVLLRNTLISLIVIFIALFVLLKMGIEADTFVFGNYKIERLYLKLDKKLTLKIAKLVIPKEKENPSLEKTDKVFDTIMYLFTFFDEIALDKIVFDNNTYRFVLENNILYISSDSYEIVGKTKREKNILIADIDRLYLKKQKVLLKGKLQYNFKVNHLWVDGDFDGYEIQGKFHATKQGKYVDFNLSTQPFSSLVSVIDTMPMSDTLHSWIVDKTKVEKYTIRHLQGRGVVGEDGFEIDYDTLKANVYLEKVRIAYHEKLSDVRVDDAILTYRNKGLYFTLNHPTYEGRDLSNSTIAITHLGKHAILSLDLKIKTLLDKVLHNVLTAYRIDIPVTHRENLSNVAVKLNIPLGRKGKKRKLSVLVDVEVGQGTLQYKDIGLPLKTAHARYDNHLSNPLKIEAILSKGDISLGKTLLPVRKGNIDYTKDKIALKDIHLRSSWYDTKLNGTLSLRDKKLDAVLDIDKLSLGENVKFLSIKNKTIPLKLDFEKNIDATLPTLDTTIAYKSNHLDIKLANLKKIKPFLQLRGIDFDGGNAEIIQKSKEKYYLKGILKRKQCFFYAHDNRCYTRIPYRATIDKKGLNFYAFGDRVHFNAKKSRLYLNKIHIDLEKLLAQQMHAKSTSKTTNKLIILGKKSHLRYGRYKLIMDSYDIELSSNGSIKAMGSIDGNIVKFHKKGDEFTLDALRVTDTMLHPLIGFDGLKKGRYSIHLKGNPKKKMQGTIIIEGGVMRDFKVYNNTLAFINALPAIATLSNPGFSQEGFKIIEGVAKYTMYDSSRIVFDSIYIKGESATLVGKGEIDFKQKTIAMQLAIQTARELGKVVGNIPLLGYILMGQDKSFTVGLEVSGRLSKPEIKTSATKDILGLPLELLKRTLESPIHILNK